MITKLFLSSALLIGLSAAVISAQEPASEPKAPAADSQETQGLATPKTEHVMGTISKVDASSNSLTLKSDDDKERSFTVDSAAKITLDGKSATLADLKAGQKVTVNADTNNASSISASSGS
jgi:Cu/Ag efflux protein CusF